MEWFPLSIAVVHVDNIFATGGKSRRPGWSGDNIDGVDDAERAQGDW